MGVLHPAAVLHGAAIADHAAEAAPTAGVEEAAVLRHQAAGTRCRLLHCGPLPQAAATGAHRLQHRQRAQRVSNKCHVTWDKEEAEEGSKGGLLVLSNNFDYY